jgi:Zn-dependent peptidase ImmA (M78 family)
VLAAIAKALRLPATYFDDDAPLELTGVEYRASSRMTPVSKRMIHDEIRKQLGLRREIEVLVPEVRSPVLALPSRQSRIVSMQAVEDVAEALRKVWGLGAQPISNLTNLLEAHGVRVVHVTISDGWFDGLSARVDDWPVVVVGANWPGDRQRFTLAHELGHLVLAGRLKDGLDEERACHRFAGAFLAPRSAVMEIYVGDSVSPMELVLLKHEWGLSMGAWVYRLQNLGRIREDAVRTLWREFRANGWNKTEPGPQLPRESATTWQRQLCSLVANGRISKAKAAQATGTSEETLTAMLAMR